MGRYNTSELCSYRTGRGFACNIYSRPQHLVLLAANLARSSKDMYSSVARLERGRSGSDVDEHVRSPYVRSRALYNRGGFKLEEWDGLKDSPTNMPRSCSHSAVAMHSCGVSSADSHPFGVRNCTRRCLASAKGRFSYFSRSGCILASVTNETQDSPDTTKHAVSSGKYCAATGRLRRETFEQVAADTPC
jgi:hypothetical protein